MRTFTAHLFSSADGVVESPNLFQFDSFDQETGWAMGAAITGSDATILGRTLYDEWSGYFPGASDPFADYINPVRKYVPSRTLTGPLSWENAELVTGDFLDFARELKAGQGGAVTVNGISVIRQLFLAGLIDTLTFTVHPVLVGEGRRLLDEHATTRMELVDSKITSKGNALLSYQLRASE